MHAQKSKNFHNKCTGYDIKRSDDEDPVWKILGVLSTPSMSSLPGPL